MQKSLAQRIHDILAKRQEEITNFPEAGDDLKVSLRNSQYEMFPLKEAMAIKEDYPQVWGLGGNVLGGRSFAALTPIAERGGNTETPGEERAVRRREAWAARHFKDFRAAGVIAQVKWLTVGSRGLDHMRKVIQEEKDKLEEKGERITPNPCWDGYEAIGLKPNGDPNCVPLKTLDKINNILDRGC
jgi:hypothetical protein